MLNERFQYIESLDSLILSSLSCSEVGKKRCHQIKFIDLLKERHRPLSDLPRAAERNRGARGKNVFGGPIIFSRQPKKTRYTSSYIACSPKNAAVRRRLCLVLGPILMCPYSILPKCSNLRVPTSNLGALFI